MLVQKENGEGQYIFAASLPRGELQGGEPGGKKGPCLCHDSWLRTMAPLQNVHKWPFWSNHVIPM